MNLFAKKILATFLSATLVLSAVAMAADKQDDTKKLAETQAAIEQLKQQLADIKSKRSDLEKQLQDSETSINDTMKRIEDLKKQIKDQEAKQGALDAGKKKP